MEITLEKIELVKDRTGVSYKEAKEALEASDGSVVDAIIAIEDTIDENAGSKVNETAAEVMDKIKELVKKGNISKISVKKDEETILNLPLNVGIVGTLVAPWGVIAGVIAAFGFKCKIELTKDDGTVIDISQRAGNIYSEVAEKGSVVVDEVVAKGSAAVGDVIEKSTDAYNNIKDAAAEKLSVLKNKKAEFSEDLEEKIDELGEKFDSFGEKLEDAGDKAEEKATETLEQLKSKL